MNRKKRWIIYISTTFIAIALLWSFSVHKTEAFSPQVIQQGAVGEDVIELQARLKHIGFYNGKIDGVFGWSTYWALRNFQYEFGMEIDGMAGQQAKEKLVKATKFDRKKVEEELTEKSKTAPQKEKPKAEQENQQQQEQPQKEQEAMKQETGAVNVPQGFSQNDIQLMANAVYGEARGEPYEGQVAVAAVILNRVEHADFPDTVGGVIFQPGAFTAVDDGQIWLTPNERATEAVIDAINGWDPSENAIYYFNPITATSKWIWSRPQIKKIGLHIFCS